MNNIFFFFLGDHLEIYFTELLNALSIKEGINGHKIIYVCKRLNNFIRFKTRKTI